MENSHGKLQPVTSFILHRGDIGVTLLIRNFLPIVGMVRTTFPIFKLYNIVVFPAQSNPIIRILTSFELKSFLKIPLLAVASTLPEFPMI